MLQLWSAETLASPASGEPRETRSNNATVNTIGMMEQQRRKKRSAGVMSFPQLRSTEAVAQANSRMLSAETLEVSEVFRHVRDIADTDP